MRIPTLALATLLFAGDTADALAAALRRHTPPVFTRIQDDAVWLDPRTLFEGDADAIVAAYGFASASAGGAAS